VMCDVRRTEQNKRRHFPQILYQKSEKHPKAQTTNHQRTSLAYRKSIEFQGRSLVENQQHRVDSPEQNVRYKVLKWQESIKPVMPPPKQHQRTPLASRNGQFIELQRRFSVDKQQQHHCVDSSKQNVRYRVLKWQESFKPVMPPPKQNQRTPLAYRYGQCIEFQAHVSGENQQHRVDGPKLYGRYKVLKCQESNEPVTTPPSKQHERKPLTYPNGQSIEFQRHLSGENHHHGAHSPKQNERHQERKSSENSTEPVMLPPPKRHHRKPLATRNGQSIENDEADKRQSHSKEPIKQVKAYRGHWIVRIEQEWSQSGMIIRRITKQRASTPETPSKIDQSSAPPLQLRSGTEEMYPKILLQVENHGAANSSEKESVASKEESVSTIQPISLNQKDRIDTLVTLQDQQSHPLLASGTQEMQTWGEGEGETNGSDNSMLPRKSDLCIDTRLELLQSELC